MTLICLCGYAHEPPVLAPFPHACARCGACWRCGKNTGNLALLSANF